MSYVPAPALRAHRALYHRVNNLVVLCGLTLSFTTIRAAPTATGGASHPAPEPPKQDQGAQVKVAPPVTKLSCGPRPVRAGLPTLCTLKVTHSDRISIKVSLPAGVEEGVARPAQVLPEGQLLAERAFTVRHLALDKPLRIKGVSVTWDHTGGQSGVVELPPQRLDVVPSISSVLEPKPRTFQDPLPKAPERAEALERAKRAFWAQHGPPPLIELNWALIIALAALLISTIGIGLGWLIRRWVEAARQARQPVVDTRPAYVIALEAFELLKQRRLPEEGQTKAFYHELSEIIRTYLGRRLGLSGLEMTSDELRSASSSAALTSEQGLLIDQFLTDSDLVKFADVSPSLKAVDDISALALHVIAAMRTREELPSNREVPLDDGAATQEEELT